MVRTTAATTHTILSSLPEALRNQDSIKKIAKRLADEVLRYGVGSLPLDVEAGDVEAMICEDLESTHLLASLLATEEDEGEELTPEQRAERLQTKAAEVKEKLDSGNSLFDMIRIELADTDCGACDHPTCDAYGKAIAEGKDGDLNKCDPGGPMTTAQVELVFATGNNQALDTDKLIAIEDTAQSSKGSGGSIRCLELGSGKGFPSVVLAALYPDVDFEVLESNTKRSWFQTRLMNLMGIRNCRIRVIADDAMENRYYSAYDLVLLKGMSATEAMTKGASFAKPGGSIAVWQDKGWSSTASNYMHAGSGMTMPLKAPMHFESKGLEGSVLLLATRPEEETADEVAE